MSNMTNLKLRDYTKFHRHHDMTDREVIAHHRLCGAAHLIGQILMSKGENFVAYIPKPGYFVHLTEYKGKWEMAMTHGETQEDCPLLFQDIFMSGSDAEGQDEFREWMEDWLKTPTYVINGEGNIDLPIRPTRRES